MSGSGISWAICKSAPHHSVFTGRMPFLPPNQQRQSTEGNTPQDIPSKYNQQLFCSRVGYTITPWTSDLIWSSAVLHPRVGYTMDVLSPLISVLCHSGWLFHGESCPRLDAVHPGRAWPSSPSCTWHCSLHYLFLQATPLFPRGVTTVC